MNPFIHLTEGADPACRQARPYPRPRGDVGKRRLRLNGVLVIWILVIGFFWSFGFWNSEFAKADETARKTIIDEVPAALNVVLKKPDDGTRWLLKLRGGSGCPTFLKGQEVTLAVSGDLNGNNDAVYAGIGYRCAIDKAYEFNEILKVTYAYRNETEVLDESGQAYSLFKYEGCDSLINYEGQAIYANRSGPTLNVGDILYIPGDPRQCAIKTLEILPKKTEEPEEGEGDTVRPPDVTRVKAVPRKGAAFVYWPEVQDNVAINFYLVTYTASELNFKTLTTENAPNILRTKDNSLLVEGLENERTYFFYVLAVDTSGNESSFWSQPAEATIKSAIAPDPVKSEKSQDLALKKISETEKTLFFKWNKLPTATRFLITIKSGGKLLFTRHPYTRNQLKLPKHKAWKGKTLELKVSAFDEHGFLKEEMIEFGF